MRDSKVVTDVVIVVMVDKTFCRRSCGEEKIQGRVFGREDAG